jgi:putative ABC transport system permease protein
MGGIVCVILLITAFGFETLMQYITNQINDVYTYDLRVDYKGPIVSGKSNLPEGIKNSYSLSSYPVELVTLIGNEDATLTVTKKENNLINFFDENNEKISLEDNGVFVPKSYSDKYGIMQGDIIKLRFIVFI